RLAEHHTRDSRRRRSFNTPPPEGGWNTADEKLANNLVTTHSRPKAAGDRRDYGDYKKWFQHKAARRRLVTSDFFKSTGIKVSTHS
ncbi:hypothetical protein ACTHTN_20120, partial [Neisseria sp. P0015.S006]